MSSSQFINKIFILVCFLLLIIISTIELKAEVVSKIIVLVNGKPITQSDFQNRARFKKSLGENLSDEMISNLTINELINEAIKLYAAEGVGIRYSEEIVSNNLDTQLRSQGTNLIEYNKLLESNQINPQTIIDQRIADESWRQFILQKYRRLADITKEDIDLYKRKLISDETFHVQLLKINNSSYENSYYLAEKITNDFESCAKNLIDYKENKSITIEDNLNIKPTELDEPFSAILEFKHDQFVLPIQNVDNQLVVMINCTPKNLISDFEVENILLGEKIEFFAEKELRNLRQDSIIDYKG